MLRANRLSRDPDRSVDRLDELACRSRRGLLLALFASLGLVAVSTPAPRAQARRAASATAPVILAFNGRSPVYPDPYGNPPGPVSTLVWLVEGADACSIDRGVGTVNKVTGNVDVTVAPSNSSVEEKRFVFTLSCSNARGTSQASTVITYHRTGKHTIGGLLLPGPYITALAASSPIRPGKAALLSWDAEILADDELAYCELNRGIGVVPMHGTLTVTPGQTTDYVLTCVAFGVQRTATVRVHVRDAPPRITGFYADPATITSGASSTLRWTVANADSCSISPTPSGAVSADSDPAANQVAIAPAGTTAYTLTCTSSAGSDSAQATVTVRTWTQPAPAIASFGASSTTIVRGAGASVTLSWSSSGATGCTIGGNGQLVGSYGASGSINVTPASDALYVLTCVSGEGRPSTSTVQVRATSSGANSATGCGYETAAGTMPRDWVTVGPQVTNVEELSLPAGTFQVPRTSGWYLVKRPLGHWFHSGVCYYDADAEPSLRERFPYCRGGFQRDGTLAAILWSEMQIRDNGITPAETFHSITPGQAAAGLGQAAWDQSMSNFLVHAQTKYEQNKIPYSLFYNLTSFGRCDGVCNTYSGYVLAGLGFWGPEPWGVGKLPGQEVATRSRGDGDKVLIHHNAYAALLYDVWATYGTFQPACERDMTAPAGGICATCGDGRHNGLESDTDCGGVNCAPCANGKQCNRGADCTSGNCTAGQCSPGNVWGHAQLGGNCGTVEESHQVAAEEEWHVAGCYTVHAYCERDNGNRLRARRRVHLPPPNPPQPYSDGPWVTLNSGDQCSNVGGVTCCWNPARPDWGRARRTARPLPVADAWHATDGCQRLDVSFPRRNKGGGHWKNISVYSRAGAFLGRLSRYHRKKGGCNTYFAGSTRWPASYYRFHGTRAQLRREGLPRHIRVRFEDKLRRPYSGMSKLFDLGGGRLPRPSIKHVGGACPRIEVGYPGKHKGGGHWKRVAVYSAGGTYLGLLRKYHRKGSCSQYAGNAAGRSVYRFHGTRGALRNRGLPRKVKVRFVSPYGVAYSRMSSVLDLGAPPRPGPPRPPPPREDPPKPKPKPGVPLPRHPKQR